MDVSVGGYISGCQCGKLHQWMLLKEAIFSGNENEGQATSAGTNSCDKQGRLGSLCFLFSTEWTAAEGSGAVC